VPLLLLVVAVETRLTARLVTAFTESLGGWWSVDDPADIDGRPSRLTFPSPDVGKTTNDGGSFWLMAVAMLSAPAALLVEVVVLASVPFVSEGSPGRRESGWYSVSHWSPWRCWPLSPCMG
jgi:hypothetical protein